MAERIFESEYRFCLILWRYEPIASGELVKRCAEELGWKPTTTYTVIKRLSERGIVKNEHSVVTSLVSKEDVQADDMDDLIEKRFEGSVPAFLAAFTRREKLSDEEFRQLSDLIERFRKGDS